LRANLVSSDMEWAQFESLFHEYLDAAQEEPPEETRESPSGGHGEKKRDPGGEFLPDVETDTSTEADRPEEKAWLEGVAYSPVSLMAPFTVQKTRRSRRSRKGGTLDFPLMMRKSLKTGGVPLDLFYREKRKRLKRLVILADVSGSMDRYARFVMPFLLGIRGIGSRAEVFVFSTSLTPIAPEPGKGPGTNFPGSARMVGRDPHRLFPPSIQPGTRGYTPESAHRGGHPQRRVGLGRQGFAGTGDAKSEEEIPHGDLAQPPGRGS
ncbi:MAG: VWA domain-containing protein, partial [Deltaproteobacteria bacterium]|nr:VWA domain-containing protein [Deltaproteobacteria bacterium]